jgi:hypothetical protein
LWNFLLTAGRYLVIHPTSFSRDSVSHPTITEPARPQTIA